MTTEQVELLRKAQSEAKRVLRETQADLLPDADRLTELSQRLAGNLNELDQMTDVERRLVRLCVGMTTATVKLAITDAVLFSASADSN